MKYSCDRRVYFWNLCKDPQNKNVSAPLCDRGGSGVRHTGSELCLEYDVHATQATTCISWDFAERKNRQTRGHVPAQLGRIGRICRGEYLSEKQKQLLRKNSHPRQPQKSKSATRQKQGGPLGGLKVPLKLPEVKREDSVGELVLGIVANVRARDVIRAACKDGMYTVEFPGLQETVQRPMKDLLKLRDMREGKNFACAAAETISQEDRHLFRAKF